MLCQKQQSKNKKRQKKRRQKKNTFVNKLWPINKTGHLCHGHNVFMTVESGSQYVTMMHGSLSSAKLVSTACGFRVHGTQSSAVQTALCCYIKQELGVTKAVFCTLFFTESYFVAYSKCKGRCSSHTHVSVWHSRTW